MPTDDRLGTNEDENIAPAGPKPARRDPEDAVHPSKARAECLPLQDSELLPKSQVLRRHGWSGEQGYDETSQA